MNNYIYEYYRKITDGTIIVGRWIKVWYKYVVDGLEKGLFHFDPKKARKAIRFVENFCRHHEGALAPQLISADCAGVMAKGAFVGAVRRDGRHRSPPIS